MNSSIIDQYKTIVSNNNNNTMPAAHPPLTAARAHHFTAAYELIPSPKPKVYSVVYFSRQSANAAEIKHSNRYK